jgi:hypothetical protein
VPSEGQVQIGTAPPAPARIDVGEAGVDIAQDGGAQVHVPFVDIEDLHDDNYVLALTDFTGTRYELTMLGRAYGQVAADIRKRRDAALERDLLLVGVKLQDTFPAKLFGGREPQPIQVRLYEDLLVVLPERGTMFGVPYSFIEGVEWDEELYQVHVVTDEGRDLVFGHLAKRSEEFLDELKRLLEGLAKRTAATLRLLVPGLPEAVIGPLAALMRDGRAAQRWQIDAVDPSIWPRLEEVAAATPELRASYQRLRSMTVEPWAAFGVKAVKTAGEEEGPAPETAPPEESAAATADGVPSGAVTDLWYFCPLQDGGRPINVVAQEVASASGHATYLFRLLPQDRFAALEGDELAAEVARSIHRLNRALLQLNFRREPIYLPDEEIAEGPYARYRVALRSLEHLREARERFLGRAAHTASWEAQVREAAGRV